MAPGPSPANAVLLADDALFLEHREPPDHPERAARLLAVRQGLQQAARATATTFDPLATRDATDDELGRVHDPAYVDSIGHLAGRHGYLDSDTYVSPGSVAAARRAAGSAAGLVDALHAGRARFGVTAVRPPGHHALPDRAMGFCLLNNVAIAAARARALGLARVLVLDWDVHHGNGTEAMFYDDPSVLFVSLHQFPNYPGTGAAKDVGSGEGRGATVNLPLPPGATDAVYCAALERVVLPIVEQFQPELALVSCGFDAHARDPLADMRLTGAGYAAMTHALLGSLASTCPVGVVLEGGYDLDALVESSAAVASVLFGESPSQLAPSEPSPEHAAVLAEVARVQSTYWKLP